MINNGANLMAGKDLPAGANVGPTSAFPARASAYTGGAGRRAPVLTAPLAVATFSYSGRVGNFYSVPRACYSETYEPARQSPFGPIGKIESRLVGGRWRHVAYRSSGESVLSSDDDLVLFDQTTLPLMFNPDEEIIFAQKLLSSGNDIEVFNLSRDVVVYANRDRSSIGIIRLKITV